MKAVILAGGEGTRLRPLTLTTPKPVVPVVDRPFLRHQLDLLTGAGVREVVFSVAYRPERVEAVFGDGSAFGVRIRYAVEESPLGTGGAVRNALPMLDERTIVLNGDVLTDVDLAGVVARHDAQGASATILLTPVPNPAAYGLVETDPDGRVQPLSREAAARADHDEHDQRGHLRARDPGPRPDARGRQLLDRARVLPRPARPRGPGPRAGSPRVLDRHRHAGQVPPGPPRHTEPPLPRAPGRGAPRRGLRPPDRPRVGRGAPRRALLRGTGMRGRGAARGWAPTPSSSPTCASGPAPACATASCGGASRRGPDCELQGCLIGPGVRLGRSSVLRNAVLGEGSVVSDFSRTL